MADFALKREVDIGDRFSQQGVEDLFDTDFGYQFKGITYRHPPEGKYVILLQNEGEIYDDEITTGREFTYEGEGLPRKGDQVETAANKALIDAKSEPIPIYLFTSTEGVDEYEYRGLVEILDYRYVPRDGRMVYRFDAMRLEVASWTEYRGLEEDLEENSREPPTLEEDASYTHSEARVRSSHFSRKIKEIYDYSCAVCGKQRFSPEGSPEVEAAHIYPKSENGSDDFRNGIALCRFHHWAFDSGWFSISDDFEVMVTTDADYETPERVSSIEGQRISVPTESDFVPTPLFLGAHRRLHQFE